jgi:hypothetical protein
MNPLVQLLNASVAKVELRIPSRQVDDPQFVTARPVAHVATDRAVRPGQPGLRPMPGDLQLLERPVALASDAGQFLDQGSIRTAWASGRG